MPGFNINGGKGFETNTAESIRAHRWWIDKLGPIDNISGRNTWYAKTFSFPAISAKITKALGASIEYKFAESIEYGIANITFYDMVISEGTTTLKVLRKWGSLAYGTDYNAIGFADEYKHQSIFSMDDNKGFPIFRIVLHNSWPSKIEHSELSYTESTIAEVSAELTFDWYTTPSVPAPALLASSNAGIGGPKLNIGNFGNQTG